MDFAEQVRFCRTELEKARRDFPAASTEVQAAENLYVRALNDATCGGSPAVTGSDLSLTDDSKIHVVSYCDKVNVTAVFYVGEDRVGKPRILGAADAVTLGQQVADTGILRDCPVEVSIAAIKNFGLRLKAYGQTCL
jgi:hypothetical protein